jgi:hypothetical protein
MSGKSSRKKQNRVASGKRRKHGIAYQSRFTIDRLDVQHPGLRAMVEELTRRRVHRDEIVRQLRKKFGVNVSINAVRRYWKARVHPQEEAEAAAYREAHGQARALIVEMKADRNLDAARIAEIMLANQIVRDRTKLAEADIMELYREQRERRKLELQSRALRLREKQTRQVLAKRKKSDHPAQLEPEVIRAIEEIYGLLPEPAPQPPPEPAPAP